MGQSVSFRPLTYSLYFRSELNQTLHGVKVPGMNKKAFRGQAVIIPAIHLLGKTQERTGRLKDSILK